MELEETEQLKHEFLKAHILEMIQDRIVGGISNKKLSQLIGVPRSEVKRIRKELVEEKKIKPGQ